MSLADDIGYEPDFEPPENIWRTEVWRNAKGELIRIADMNDDYLGAVYKFCLCRYRENHTAIVIKAIEREMLYRLWKEKMNRGLDKSSGDEVEF